MMQPVTAITPACRKSIYKNVFCICIRIELLFHISYGNAGMSGIDTIHFRRPLHAFRTPLLRLAALSLCSVPLLAKADLPKPASVIYRCEAGGKVVYSDEPCMGARVVDATPNSGVDSLSGHGPSDFCVGK